MQHFRRALDGYRGRYGEDDPEGQLLIAITLAELGRTYLAAGDVAAAEEYLDQSYTIRQRIFPQRDYPFGHPSLATALRDLGRVHFAKQDFDRAVATFIASVGMEQSVADSFVGGGSETLLVNMAAHRFESLDGALAAWSRSQLSPAVVYEQLWWRRGLVPRLLAQRYRAMSGQAAEGVTPTLESYVQVRRELSRALLVSVPADELENHAPVAELQQLNARKEQLEGQLLEELQLDRDEHRGRSPQMLGEALPRGAAFVDFVRYRPQVAEPLWTSAQQTDASQFLAFVVVPHQPIVCVPLGEASPIEMRVHQWLAAIDARVGTPAAQELTSLVWDPVCRHLPAATDTIYLAPDGDLALLPWNALPLQGPAQLAIERYQIATVPHGLFLLDALQNPGPDDGENGFVLGVGDLDFGQRPTDAEPLGVKRLRWRPLAGSAIELEGIEAAAGKRRCVRLAGQSATRSAVIAQLAECRWAHFATHGFFLDDQLWNSLQLLPEPNADALLDARSRAGVLLRNPFIRSGLALSGANEWLGGPDDRLPDQVTGILTAEAITTVDCSGLELVVLSACESGRGDVVHGDGVFGMQMAFHAAGARNVVASLWKIDDTSTAELVAAFYDLLWNKQLPPLAALRTAQLQMLDTYRQETLRRGPALSSSVPLPRSKAHPAGPAPVAVRHWAAFSLSGPGF